MYTYILTWYSYFCTILGNARIAEKCIKFMINDRIRKKCSNGFLMFPHVSTHPPEQRSCAHLMRTRFPSSKSINGFVFGASEF